MMRAIVAFIAVAYGLAVALGIAIGMTGGYESLLVDLGVLAMFAPRLGALVVGITMQERLRIDWSRFPVAFLPVALLLIPMACMRACFQSCSVSGLSLGGVADATTGWSLPHADFTSVGRAHGAEPRGPHRHQRGGWPHRRVSSGLVRRDRLAWVVLPRLATRFGIRRAVALTAIVWGLWHVPLGLSGIQHIDGVSPLEMAVGIPAGAVAAGLVIGWLWVRTESIWIVAIAHGALNDWGQYAFKYMEAFTAPDQRVVLGAGFVVLYCVAAVLLAFGVPAAVPARADSAPIL